MSWEKRKRGGRYYTRSRRVNGRIVREYIGSGRIAELAAQLDELDREERELERFQLQHEKAQAEAFAAPVIDLHDMAELIARGALLAAGYHRHKGGEWRRKRDI